MGRRGLSRSVKRISPSADALARYIQLWRYEDEAERGPFLQPVTSQALFGTVRPLELEVGCGTGEYLCALAEAHPERSFVGLDPSTVSLQFAAHLADSLKLENLRLIRAPISALYRYLVPDQLETVYVHFPDPFVRARGQHKVLNRLFLEQMHGALRPGGVLSVVSDKPELFHEALNLIERAAGWEKVHPERFLVGFEPRVKSRYQLKWERYQVNALRVEVAKKPLARSACA